MRDRRGIREERAGGASIRGIARSTGASRNAVRRALDPDARMDYHRASMAEEFEPAVRDVLADYPHITVLQVAEIVEWPGSRRTLTDLVARLRPEAIRRQIEDLPRPQIGRLSPGSITIGSATTGRLTVGSVHVGHEAPHPNRTT